MPPQIIHIDDRFDWNGSADLEICPIRGLCLSPKFMPGDLAYVDLTLKPRHGDFALVDMLVGRVSKIDGSISRGRERGLKKVVRKPDGSDWLWCNDLEFRTNWAHSAGRDGARGSI